MAIWLPNATQRALSPLHGNASDRTTAATMARVKLSGTRREILFIGAVAAALLLRFRSCVVVPTALCVWMAGGRVEVRP
jgi:hypothetical protein